MKGAGVNEPEDLPQEVELVGAVVVLSPLVEAGLSVCSAVDLSPPMPKLGKNVLAAKNTAATIATVMSNRENVVNRAIVS